MADTRNYDLLDKLNCADSCEAVTALYDLLNHLLEDIQHLELECINTRYLPSQYMDYGQGELLRMDILKNLGRRYKDDPAYALYRSLKYDGGDPMDFHDYLVKVRETSKGNRPCWH